MGKFKITCDILTDGYRYLRAAGWKRVALDDRKREAALSKLMEVYSQRPDLQEVYPEAADGDLGRLMNWAAGVSWGRWKDSSRDVLRPYAGTFHNLPRTAPELSTPPWAMAARTSQASENRLTLTLRTMEERGSADISNHLMTLALLIREFKLPNVVELGTRDGNSTLALLEATRDLRGSVTSVDIEPCLDARRRVEDAGFSQTWTFIQANDMDLHPPQIPARIDLLFIDTSHLYSPTLAELNKYSAYMGPGGWIALHDYVSFPGVHRAVHEFVKSAVFPIRFYPFMHQNGLALLRRTAEAASPEGT